MKRTVGSDRNPFQDEDQNLAVLFLCKIGKELDLWEESRVKYKIHFEKMEKEEHSRQRITKKMGNYLNEYDFTKA